jgi:hypothetical protein
MNTMMKLLAMALMAVVVVLAFVPSEVDGASCELGLTTWYSKQGNCEGQSGCATGTVSDGCSKLGDHWLQVDCANQRVQIFSTQECGGQSIGTVLDGDCVTAPNPIPLSWKANWDGSCSSAAALASWVQYLGF